MARNEHRAVVLLQDLVSRPSVNPAYDHSSPGEALVGEYIERWADSLGLRVEQQPVLEGRFNVISRLIVSDDLPTLLFESHMDTVGIAGNTRAGFVPELDGDLIYGRGTCDTKGSMAAMMAAIERLVRRRHELACNIEFLAAVDEETIGSGSLAYARSNPQVAAAIVGEPTGNQIVNAHRGVVRGRITVHGRAAHTSVAHEGVNAIDGMADVILALRDVSQLLASNPDAGVLTVSMIEGGAGINVVPASCSIRFDRRTVPGDTTALVFTEIDSALDRVRRERSDIVVERHTDLELDVSALNTPMDSPIVRSALRAAAETGLSSDLISVPYGSDASYLNDIAGIPCIVFGPGSIDVAHGPDEHVALSEVIQASEFLIATAIAFGKVDD